MRKFIPWLILITFLGVLTGANVYLAHRFNLYFGIEKTMVLHFIFPALTLFMLFGMMPLSNTTSRLGSYAYISAATITGIMLYLLLSVLAVDIAGFFTDFPPRIYGFTALAITFLISVFGIINSWNIQVTKKEVKIEGLTKTVRAMHLSDIHIGHFRGKKFLQQIVRKTNKAKVDVVFITGDLFDGRIRLSQETLEPLKHLIVPVFFVEGNHDRYTGVETIKKLLRQTGIRVLENEMVNWSDFQIIGLNHMKADSHTYNMHAAGNHSTIKGTLENLAPDKNKPSILLHHSPDGIQYAGKNGIDLYLSGHTHAGQLFPIKYIASMIFDYNKGIHRFNGTTIFVSQGAGTFGPPMRVGTKSEITIVELQAATPIHPG